MRRQTRDDFGNALPVGVQAIGLIERGIERDPLEKRTDRTRHCRIVSPVPDRAHRTRRRNRRPGPCRPSCREADWHPFLLELVENGGEIVFERRDGQPAQHVVGAQPQEGGIGTLGQRPVEPRGAIGAGISGNAGIGDWASTPRLPVRRRAGRQIPPPCLPARIPPSASRHKEG